MYYRGQLPTTLLNRQQIRPTEHRDWDDAARYFDRRRKHKAKVEELMVSISRNGLRDPIILGIDDRHHGVYVADGHHRAVALRELGIPTFTFTWYWIRSFGVRMERGPFPSHLAGF